MLKKRASERGQFERRNKGFKKLFCKNTPAPDGFSGEIHQISKIR